MFLFLKPKIKTGTLSWLHAGLYRERRQYKEAAAGWPLGADGGRSGLLDLGAQSAIPQASCILTVMS